MATTSHSYANNDDGDGIFFNDRVVKGLKKLNLFDFRDELNKELTAMVELVGRCLPLNGNN